MNYPAPASLTITCIYRNETSRMQVARIDNAPEFYLERMVLPGQCLVFEAPAEAHLEIHSGTMMTAILEDTIPCEQLQYVANDKTVVSLHSATVKAAA
jgi:hypothetical protein